MKKEGVLVLQEPVRGRYLAGLDMIRGRGWRGRPRRKEGSRSDRRRKRKMARKKKGERKEAILGGGEHAEMHMPRLHKKGIYVFGCKGEGLPEELRRMVVCHSVGSLLKKGPNFQVEPHAEDGEDTRQRVLGTTVARLAEGVSRRLKGHIAADTAFAGDVAIPAWASQKDPKRGAMKWLNDMGLGDKWRPSKHIVSKKTREEGMGYVGKKRDGEAWWSVKMPRELGKMSRWAPRLCTIAERLAEEMESAWEQEEVRKGEGVEERGAERFKGRMGTVDRTMKRFVSLLRKHKMVMREADKGGGVCLFPERLENVFRSAHIAHPGAYLKLEEWVLERLGEERFYRMRDGRNVRSTLSFRIPWETNDGKGEWSEESYVGTMLSRLEYFLAHILPNIHAGANEVVGRLPAYVLDRLAAWAPWGRPPRALQGYNEPDEDKRQRMKMPHIEGLFKVHKKELTYRPVARAPNGPLKEAERLVGQILADLMMDESSISKDSTEVIRDLSDLERRLDRGKRHEWVSFDIDNMYPCFEHEWLFGAVDAFLEEMVQKEDGITRKGKEFILQLVMFTTEHSLLSAKVEKVGENGARGAEKEVVVQVQGVAIGGSASGQFANACLLVDERKILGELGQGIPFYKRFQDDGLALVERGEVASQLMEKWDGAAECISFTWEKHPQRVNFLDITVELHEAPAWGEEKNRRGARVLTEVFHKKQRRVAYPMADSRTPWKTKVGTMKGELIRNIRLNSTPTKFGRARYSLKRDFLARGYKAWEIEEAWKGISYKNRAQWLNPGGVDPAAGAWDMVLCSPIPFGGRASRWKRAMGTGERRRQMDISRIRDDVEREERQAWAEENERRQQQGLREKPWRKERGDEARLMPSRVQFNEQKGITTSSWVRKGIRRQ
jgi:hypothetical protein